MAKLIPIDKAAKFLRQLGWSTGDFAYRQGGATAWQVTCFREGQTIVARAPTQQEAWNLALEQAGKVERAG